MTRQEELKESLRQHKRIFAEAFKNKPKEGTPSHKAWHRNVTQIASRIRALNEKLAAENQVILISGKCKKETETIHGKIFIPTPFTAIYEGITEEAALIKLRKNLNFIEEKTITIKTLQKGEISFDI